MFFKSLLLGAACAVVAGGVVYFSALPISDRAPRATASQKSIAVNVDPAETKTAANEDEIVSETQVLRTDETRPQKQKIFTFNRAKDKGPADGEIAADDRREASDRLTQNDAARNFALAMLEIEKIEAPDLSEQAYFSLANYALREGRFYDAERAIARIETVEMKETARIRMAIALARSGKADEAFAMVEQVEAKEYQDILRLQVVEALGTNNPSETRFSAD